MATAAPIEAVLERVPVLAGRVYRCDPLPGGLTNANYKVTTDAGAYVVRRWSPDGGPLAIDRDNEYENSERAAAAGVGAPVIAYLPQQCALVLGFLDGETLTPEALRSGDPLERAAQACRRLHGAERFRDDFDMFATQARYLAICRERGFRLPEDYDDFAPHLDAVRDVLAARPEATVPCNNDLLAENLIDDGHRIWLIDYEYSGNNEPSFELGNLWSEANLSPAQLERLVGAYHGAATRHTVARARLWGLMSKYGWTLWAAIQAAASEIEFDFWAWGMEKYDRAVAEFSGPEFERLLAEARRGD